MKTLAALHNPDMVAAGQDIITGFGDRGINSSLGSQWKDRVGDLDKAACKAQQEGKGNKKMNAKLRPCGKKEAKKMGCDKKIETEENKKVYGKPHFRIKDRICIDMMKILIFL